MTHKKINNYWKSKKDNKKKDIMENKRLNNKIMKDALKGIKIQTIDNSIDYAVQEYIKFNDIKIVNIDEFVKSEEFVQRIFLNRIRHDFSNYIEIVSNIKNMSPINKEKFKQKVNQMILRKYKMEA